MKNQVSMTLLQTSNKTNNKNLRHYKSKDKNVGRYKTYTKMCEALECGSVWFCVVRFSSMHKTLTQKANTLFVFGESVFLVLDKLFILG